MAAVAVGARAAGVIAAATAEAASIPPQERVEAEVVAPQVMQEVVARGVEKWEAKARRAGGLAASRSSSR